MNTKPGQRTPLTNQAQEWRWRWIQGIGMIMVCGWLLRQSETSIGDAYAFFALFWFTIASVYAGLMYLRTGD